MRTIGLSILSTAVGFAVLELLGGFSVAHKTLGGEYIQFQAVVLVGVLAGQFLASSRGVWVQLAVSAIGGHLGAVVGIAVVTMLRGQDVLDPNHPFSHLGLLLTVYSFVCFGWLWGLVSRLPLSLYERARRQRLEGSAT